jgi:DNA-binding response OmpR family regulator
MSNAGTPVTIVMIEDDEGHSRLIEKNIRRAGVSNDIVPFANGSSAIEYLLGTDGSGEANAGRHLLVLLDLNLPDMSGIDILQRLKGNKHLKTVPIVVLTTTDDSQEIQRCYDLGANVYITKPVNYDGFSNAIRQLGLFFSVIQVPQTP